MRAPPLQQQLLLLLVVVVVLAATVAAQPLVQQFTTDTVRATQCVEQSDGRTSWTGVGNMENNGASEAYVDLDGSLGASSNDVWCDEFSDLAADLPDSAVWSAGAVRLVGVGVDIQRYTEKAEQNRADDTVIVRLGTSGAGYHESNNVAKKTTDWGTDFATATYGSTNDILGLLDVNSLSLEDVSAFMVKFAVGVNDNAASDASGKSFVRRIEARVTFEVKTSVTDVSPASGDSADTLTVSADSVWSDSYLGLRCVYLWNGGADSYVTGGTYVDEGSVTCGVPLQSLLDSDVWVYTVELSYDSGSTYTSDGNTFSFVGCGNGIVEGDEECDTGNTDECCSSICKFRPDDYECRAPDGGAGCDVAELCTGASGDCPEDGYAGIGVECAAASQQQEVR